MDPNRAFNPSETRGDTLEHSIQWNDAVGSGIKAIHLEQTGFDTGNLGGGNPPGCASALAGGEGKRDYDSNSCKNKLRSLVGSQHLPGFFLHINSIEIRINCTGKLLNCEAGQVYLYKYSARNAAQLVLLESEYIGRGGVERRAWHQGSSREGGLIGGVRKVLRFKAEGRGPTAHWCI